MMGTDAALLPGFADPVIESQRVFRTVLDAMARPGMVLDLPVSPQAPAPINPAASAVLLCLVDQDTPVWFDGGAESSDVASWLGFHCGSHLVADPAQAVFALIADTMAMRPLAAFPIGSEDYPDRSATVIIQVPSLSGGPELILSGPGIRDTIALAPAGLPPEFNMWLIDNNALFPCGVDVIFACGSRIVALPRSTRLKG